LLIIKLLVNGSNVNVETTNVSLSKQEIVDVNSFEHIGVSSFSVASQEINPQELFFKPDGTKLYVIGSTSDEVHQYNLTNESIWDAFKIFTITISEQTQAPTEISILSLFSMLIFASPEFILKLIILQL
jgi:DNA-binding beta-propeller fold protein YncE